MSERLTAQRVHADVAAVLEQDPASIGAHDDLTDLGLDSIRLMALVERWRAAGSTAELADLIERPTLASWQQILVP